VGGGPNTLPLAGNSLILTASSDQKSFTLSGSHTYAKPGVHYGTVEVSDGGGGTNSKTFTEMIHGPQSISFPTIPTHAYGDAPFAISATGGGSGKAVTFASTDTKVSAVSGATSGVDGSGNGTGNATVTVLEPGTCDITASQAGDAIYYQAREVSQSFTVNKAGQTITFGTLTGKTYGDPDFTVNATGSSGLPVSFSVGTTDQCTVSGNTVTIIGAGSCTVTASQPGNASYTPATGVSQSFTITQASATIILDQNSLSPAYDGNPHLATATTSPAGLGYSVSYTDAGGTAVTHPTNAGSYSVTATITDPNYEGATTGTLVIGKANQTITVTSPAPAGATYQTGFMVAATAGSGLGIAYRSSGACANTGASFTMTGGTGTCTVRFDQAGNGNYAAAAEVNETVMAQKAGQTITFRSLANRTYGDAPFSVGATASSGLTVSFAVGSSDPCTISGSMVTITGAGSCTVTASQAGNANYTPAPSVSHTLTIAKAATTTTLTSSVTPSILGQGVSFTAKVTATNGSITPVGTITFRDGTTILASGIALDGTGAATYTTSALAVGSHSITASYSGNDNFNAGAGSAPIGQQVRYTVKVLSTSSLLFALQLQNNTGANVSASIRTVTAECVVTYAATPPTTCGTAPLETIDKAFWIVANYWGFGPTYLYGIRAQGLTRGQQYDLLVRTAGDPIWHAIQFTV
jgi:hypothetical protein